MIKKLIDGIKLEFTQFHPWLLSHLYSVSDLNWNCISIMQDGGFLLLDLFVFQSGDSCLWKIECCYSISDPPILNFTQYIEIEQAEKLGYMHTTQNFSPIPLLSDEIMFNYLKKLIEYFHQSDTHLKRFEIEIIDAENSESTWVIGWDGQHFKCHSLK